jgi:chromosome segregation ATPase
MLKKFLVDHGYYEEELSKDSGKDVAKKVSTQAVTSKTSQVSNLTSAPTKNPEIEKFVNIFLSALHRVSPKYFEMQGYLYKFEKTIGNEKERFATALNMTNISQVEMLKQIDIMMTSLTNEETTASNQIKASGERELSEKKTQLETITNQIDTRKNQIEELNQQIKTFENDKQKLDEDLSNIQKANDEVVNSVNYASTEVHDGLTTTQNKVSQFCS